MHYIKVGKYVPLDYIQIVCTQKCCHKKKYRCMLPLVFHSVHLSEGLLKVTKITDVLARAQLEFFFHRFG